LQLSLFDQPVKWGFSAYYWEEDALGDILKKELEY
jgi:hypothetical protein